LSESGLGALAGVLLGGRVADRLLAGGHVRARPVVAAACYIAAAVFFAAPLVTTSVAVALVPALLGSAALSAPNAPLDAARLDIMPPGLWGRAESVRTVLRASAVAAAPLLFGWLADRLGGGADGVRWTFLIMLVPLACSGARPPARGAQRSPRHGDGHGSGGSRRGPRQVGMSRRADRSAVAPVRRREARKGNVRHLRFPPHQPSDRSHRSR
jgi:MFS family permease